MIENIHLFAFPINLLLGIVLFLAGFAFRKKVTTFAATLSALVLFIGTSIALGIATRGGVNAILRSYPYALILCWICIVLSGAISCKIEHILRARQIMGHELAFLLTHTGILVTVFACYFGCCDKHISMVPVGFENVEMIPFDIQLQDFDIEYYPTGEPAHYEATVSIDGGAPEPLSVNHPLYRKGYDIYLSDYELEEDGRVRHCLLRFVKQPWKNVIVTGILLVLAGALGMLPKRRSNELG